MNTTSNFTRGKETGDRLALFRKYSRFRIDVETTCKYKLVGISNTLNARRTHGVVEDGGHVCDVEVVVHPELAAVEELLAKGILFRLGARVILVKGRLEDLRLDTHLLCERITRLDALHQATANVMLAMPLDLLGRLSVENETDREL